MKRTDKIAIVVAILVGLAAMIGLNALAESQVSASEPTCEWRTTATGVQICL